MLNQNPPSHLPGWIAAALILPALLLSHVSALLPPDDPQPENFDRRRAEAAPPAIAEEPQLQAAKTVSARVQAAQIAWDEITGAPKFISSPRGFLTGPQGEGGAVAAAADAVPAADPLRPVKAFVSEHRELFGHGPEALEAAHTVRDNVDPHNGLRTVVWQQRVDEIPVFRAVFKAHQTRDGELVNVSSGFVRNAAVAALKAAPDRAARQNISAAQAIAIAAQGVGDAVAADEVEVEEAAAGPEQRQRLKHPALSDVTAQYVWLPMDRTTLRLCWDVVFSSLSHSAMFRVVVDAETGEAIVREGLTEHISEARYGVFTSDSPSPFSPGHDTPSTEQPLEAPRFLLSLEALDTNASPNGWINDGVNTTLGNNVHAHTDVDANNVPDLPRPEPSRWRIFDFPLDLTLAPSTYRPAAITQLFYLCNVIHDRLYQLGFTEAWANFQTNNFGRGGLGNDAVQADAQDGSGTNNANFSTPRDGSPGRMQMYVFTGPDPDRDGDFDAEVVFHEYIHGLSNRLVGGDVGISALVSRGMGEGWSDFYAFALLSEEGDDVNGTYSTGGYVTFLLSGMQTNYYFGIRRYPYSTDPGKDPLTFKDIDPAQRDLHPNVPRRPNSDNTANQVHNMGQVWATALWEARANLITRHGFAIGNELILQLVTDGMKLSPANPNFLQARDAILQADLVLTGGANQEDLWAAFSKRGMGIGAFSPPSSTTVGLVETFDPILAITPPVNFNSGGTVGGPFAPESMSYTLTNASDAPLDWTAEHAQPWIALSESAGTIPGNSSITVTVSITETANELAIGNYSDVVTFYNLTIGVAQTRAVTLAVSAPSILLFSLDDDPGWSREGQWGFGTPTGQGGGLGFPDPTAGATGSNVFGVNLNGNYSTASPAGPFYLTTAAIDLSGYQSTRLRFKRWLNTDYQPFVDAIVQVSRNGTAWTQLFANGPSSPITDNTWQSVEYSISAVADGQSTVFIRWGYRIGSSAFAYSGWNIDDVEILGVGTPEEAALGPVSAGS
ncbi:MAG: M36 family metallopeptidase [Verrucomicrobiota bacterium]|nr:M36 family metallopeptidase [Verrucomicrobiota bacterium]